MLRRSLGHGIKPPFFLAGPFGQGYPTQVIPCTLTYWLVYKALKKSQPYSTIWQSCDALRGGMDASQSKDYVLVMLFVKYISDKYAGKPFAP